MAEMHLMLTTEVARLLRKSAETVRLYANRGKLPFLRTEGGVRLFLREDVAKLAETLGVADTPKGDNGEQTP
jgi:excisionase family DNA binding protein